MSGSSKTDDDCRPPRRELSHRLCEEREEREECEDEHREHSTAVWVHALLLNEELRKISSEYGYYGHDCIKRDDEHHACA